MRQRIGSEKSKDNKVVYPIDFVEFFFDVPLRVSSHIKILKFNGNDFLGTGGLGKVDEVKEKSDLSTQGAKFTMSGIPPEQVALVMHSNYRGALVKRWLGFVDSDDNVLDEGYLLGTWNVDTMSISSGKKATIVIAAENGFLRAKTPVNERYTNESQQEKYPDDKGLEFVEQAADDEF
jgi:hypothetical protein